MQKGNVSNTDILGRSFEFAVCIVKLSEHLPNSIAGQVIGKQLVRAGTSIGANLEEAQAGYTKDDFTYKMNIALKESREAYYWLKIAKGAGLLTANMVDGLIGEADEIRRILGAIVSTSRKNQ